jgi:predicted DNA-binding protein
MVHRSHRLSMVLKAPLFLGVISMEKRIRGEDGKYISKGKSKREVRSIRLTDETWESLNDLAVRQKMTVADFVEEWISGNVIHGGNIDLIEIAEILEEALKLKPNAGGAIKTKIREALKKIQEFM